MSNPDAPEEEQQQQQRRDPSLEILDRAPPTWTSRPPVSTASTSARSVINNDASKSKSKSKPPSSKVNGTSRAPSRPRYTGVVVEDSSSDSLEEESDGSRRRPSDQAGTGSAAEDSEGGGGAHGRIKKKKDLYVATSVRANRKRKRDSIVHRRIFPAPAPAPALDRDHGGAASTSSLMVPHLRGDAAATARSRESTPGRLVLRQETLEQLDDSDHEVPRRRFRKRTRLSQSTTSRPDQTATQPLASSADGNRPELVNEAEEEEEDQLDHSSASGEDSRSLPVTTQSARKLRAERNSLSRTTSNASHEAQDDAPPVSMTRSQTSVNEPPGDPNATPTSRRRRGRPRKPLPGHGSPELEGPDYGEQRSAQRQKAKHFGTANGGPSSYSQTAAAKEKRSHGQVDKLKTKLAEREDSFYELSDAYEKLRQRAEQAERDLLYLQKERREELARLQGSGNDPECSIRALHTKLETSEREILLLRDERDARVEDERGKADQARRESQIAMRAKDGLIQDLRSKAFKDASEARSDLNNLAHRHEQELEEERKKLDVAKADLRRMRHRIDNDTTPHELQYMQELVGRLQNDNAILASRLPTHGHAPAPGVGSYYGSSGSGGGEGHQSSSGPSAPSSSSAPSDQDGQNAAWRRKIREAESREKARVDFYKEKAERVTRQLQERDHDDQRKFDVIESARSRLEVESETLRGRLSNKTDELRRTAAERDRLNRMVPEYERLQTAHPETLQTLEQMKQRLQAITKENAAFRQERSVYISQLGNTRADIQGARAEAARFRNERDGMLHDNGRAQQVLANAARERKHHHSERTVLREKISKLQKRVKQLERGSGATSSRHANGTASDGNHAERDDLDSDSQDGVPDDDDDDDDDLRHDENVDGDYELDNGMDFDEADTTMHVDVSSGFRLDAARRSILLDEEPLTSRPARVRAPPPPPVDPLRKALEARHAELSREQSRQIESILTNRSAVQWPESRRERRPKSRVPKHKSRIYVRSECHTPYVPDELVSDSDDEFLEWESEAYARSQATNPDQGEAVVNVCWHRHILDARGTRTRAKNYAFCTTFAEDYAEIITRSPGGGTALLKHVLELVKLGQLTAEEGGLVVNTFHSAVDALAP